MNRFAVFLLVGSAIAALAPISDARPRGGVGIASAGPFPATQTIAFGAKTRNLEGGDPMQYTPQGSLASTRWLKITAMTNESGTNIIGTPIFQLDDRFFLTPRSTSSPTTYGAAWSQATQCDTTPFCSITVTEYSNSGMTVPTGNQSVITARTDTIGGISATNVYSWRENTSAAKGCVNPVTGVAGQNCEVTHVDNPSGGQLAAITALTLNSDTDTLMERNGYYNPTGEIYQAFPNAQYTGTGHVIITSENKDIGTLDTWGNPNLKSGGMMGGFQFKDFNFGDSDWKVTFDYIYFYSDVASPQLQFVSSNNNDGWGINVMHSRLEQTCNVTTPTAKIEVPIPFFANDNTLQSCPAKDGGVDNGSNIGIEDNATNDQTRQGMTALRNVFEFPTSDAFRADGCNHDIEFNTIFGSHEVGAGHLDSLQSDGLTGGVNCPFGTIAYNILANGPTDSTGLGAQGIPFMNSTLVSPGFYTSATIKNNINTVPSDSNCQFFSRVNNITLSSNADFFNPQTTTPFVASCGIDVAVGGTNATSMGNIYNTLDLTAQGGTVTNTRFKVITFTNNGAGCTAVHVIYPNFVCGDNSLETNRAYMLNEMKFTSRTATANGDGTFAGPVLPQMDDGTYCWAPDPTTVVDFSKTCAQNGTILLQ